MDEGSFPDTWYGSNPCFTAENVTTGHLMTDIVSQTYTPDTTPNAAYKTQRGISVGPLATEGSYSSGVCQFAEGEISEGPFPTASPITLSALLTDKGRDLSSNDSYQLHHSPHPPLSNEIKVASRHFWHQTGNLSTTKSLSHLVVQVFINDVRTFLCGWKDCTHPVGFCQKAQLITHIRSVHLEEKPFQCTTCGIGFSRKQEAVRHVNSMNNGKIYKCSFCRKSFVRRHIRDHHEDTCAMCDDGQSRFTNGLQMIERDTA